MCEFYNSEYNTIQYWGPPGGGGGLCSLDPWK